MRVIKIKSKKFVFYFWFAFIVLYCFVFGFGFGFAFIVLFCIWFCIVLYCIYCIVLYLVLYCIVLHLLYCIVFGFYFVLHDAALGSGSGSGGGSNCLDSSGKVGRHVPLKVEVSEFLALLQLEKRLQLGVRVDAATVLLVLQVVVADVGVDLAGHLGSSHLGTVGLAKKLGQLLGNEGGLHETGRSTVANLAALLGAGLLSSAQLLDGVALQGTEFGTKRSSKCNNLLQLGGNGGKLGRN
jgi:hypothetical protein